MATDNSSDQKTMWDTGEPLKYCVKCKKKKPYKELPKRLLDITGCVNSVAIQLNGKVFLANTFQVLGFRGNGHAELQVQYRIKRKINDVTPWHTGPYAWLTKPDLDFIGAKIVGDG